jgi:hypothetical protein
MAEKANGEDPLLKDAEEDPKEGAGLNVSTEARSSVVEDVFYSPQPIEYNLEYTLSNESSVSSPPRRGKRVKSEMSPPTTIEKPSHSHRR